MPSNVNNNDLKHYFNQIKAMLPLHGKEEKRFIADLESNMRDYVRDNPNCTVYDLYENYGKPSEVVINYFETIDTHRLMKRIKTAKWIKIAVIVVIIISLAFGAFRSTLVYMDYKAGKDQHVVEIETIIEEH